MTECDQWGFDQYSETFNRGKWIYNCCWNRVVLLRYGLQSSVAWNSHWNHLSLPRHEKILCKMDSKIVGWWAQMEPNGRRVKLYVSLPRWKGGLSTGQSLEMRNGSIILYPKWKTHWSRRWWSSEKAKRERLAGKIHGITINYSTGPRGCTIVLRIKIYDDFQILEF